MGYRIWDKAYLVTVPFVGAEAGRRQRQGSNSSEVVGKQGNDACRHMTQRKQIHAAHLGSGCLLML